MKCKCGEEMMKVNADVYYCQNCGRILDSDSLVFPGDAWFEPRNVAKPNACPQLCEVIDDWIRDLETEDIYILPKLLIKMKEFRVKHFA